MVKVVNELKALQAQVQLQQEAEQRILDSFKLYQQRFELFLHALLANGLLEVVKNAKGDRCYQVRRAILLTKQPDGTCLANTLSQIPIVLPEVAKDEEAKIVNAPK